MVFDKHASITDGVFAFGAMQVKQAEDVLCCVAFPWFVVRVRDD
jgi:hypothetical protein